jgi:hypothetical protein
MPVNFAGLVFVLSAIVTKAAIRQRSTTQRHKSRDCSDLGPTIGQSISSSTVRRLLAFHQWDERECLSCVSIIR